MRVESMQEELQLIKKLECLLIKHQELDNMIDSINSEKFRDDFQLHRLKKEKLQIRDEINILQDALHPDIIA